MAEKPFQRLRQFFAELKRRNVYKVAVAYVAVAFVAIQAADLLVPQTTLPGYADNLLIYLAVFGFPIALVVAWAFEMTPEGVRRTPESDSGEEKAPETGAESRTGYQILVGLGLVAAVLAGGWYLTGGVGGGGEPTSRLGDRSIAVLPFEALGREQPGPFTEGMHDDLLARLSNVSGLKVISRTAVQQYRGSEKTTGEIARELGVRWVLEGGVQEMGDQIQVNAQLIDPRTETHAWADTYQRDLTAESLFALQGEITKRIARSLEARLTAEEREQVERQPTEDLAAYRLYVQGRTHLDERTERGLRRGLELFGRAIERDPDYALAWSGRADALALLGSYGHGLPDTLHSSALEAARRALELDSELAEARASIGFVHIHRKNGPGALRELRRAVELRPSYARAYQWLGDLKAALGRPEQALQHLRTAVELDPNSPSLRSALAWTYWWLDGPGERALGHARESVNLESGYAHGHETVGLILSDAGRQEEAISHFRRALERTTEGSLAWGLSIGGLGTAHARAGNTARARELLDRLKRRRDAPFSEARILIALGEVDAAFHVLREVDWTLVRLWALRLMPVFDSLRDDSRFQELLRGINQDWGLNPDGSLPDSVDVSFDSPADD